MINCDEHVGQKLARIDIRASCSPMFDAVLPPEADAKAMADDLSNRLIVACLAVFPGLDWASEQIGASVLTDYIILPADERRKAFDADLASLRESFAEGDRKHEQEIDNHPDNGKRGWWRVVGVRHEAIVTDASTAREAITKAAEYVQDWESPTAYYGGEKLPEVIEA